MKVYQLVQEFLGYRTKQDKTKLPPGFLTEGSQNVLSTDSDNVKIREGYTLFGAASTDLYPIESSYEFNTKRGLQIPMRSYDDELEVYYSGAWRKLKDSWSDVGFCFASWWSTSNYQDLALFVNGDDNIYSWSGGATTFASATLNTLTKQGTSSWSEEGFLQSGTRAVIIDGTEYTYLGGEGTTTLTGVSPDPTGEGYVAGDIIFQSVNTNANKPGSDSAVFSNDYIEVLDNQLWIGSSINRNIHISKNTDFTDFAYSSPRVPGEGMVLTLDGVCRGFITQEDSMYISAGTNQWYQSLFTLSADNTAETLSVIRLKSSAQSAAKSQFAMEKIKNSVVYISQEPAFDELGRIENVDTPQSVPLSDAIKTTFKDYDFSNAHVKYFQNNIYIALPAESLVLIYNLEKGYWEAPQVLPIRRFAIIDDKLYGHSSAVPETYELFIGTNDNGNAIEAVAKFSYQNYGDRVNLKMFNLYYTEGYIASNTTLTCELNYDYNGYTTIKSYDINGNDNDIIFGTSSNSSLGKLPLGRAPLGTGTESVSNLSKFRHFKKLLKNNFFEIQAIYKSNQIDGQWELSAFGGNITAAGQELNKLKK